MVITTGFNLFIAFFFLLRSINLLRKKGGVWSWIKNMASLSDIAVSAAINCLSAVLFLVAFAILRLQPINDRVYFPKWYLKGIRDSPTSSGTYVKKFVNLDVKMYLKFLNWMPAALRMPEPELIEHAGLDSAVYVRIYLLGLKIFCPITLLAFGVLVPVNYTGENFEEMRVNRQDLTYNDIDKLSISNVAPGSRRLYAHIVMAYVFTLWTCYALYNEYRIVTKMRLHFLAAERRRPDQFTVLVRNVPPDDDESISEHVEHFFCVNHPDHYLSHQVVYNANALADMVIMKKTLQNWLTYYTNKFERNPNKRPTTKTGFLGLWGKHVDAIDFYTQQIEALSKELHLHMYTCCRLHSPKKLSTTAYCCRRIPITIKHVGEKQMTSNLPSLIITSDFTTATGGQ
ncbi:unnamed protein product [Lactuca saligna]|uniref:Uncharacterized protein n=1 Tax=Lactuca saligna TaxID=75948 RepID=A0AA35ZXD0_LACSI|nr:unnamed protein product [Lactuca saligna]